MGSSSTTSRYNTRSGGGNRGVRLVCQVLVVNYAEDSDVEFNILKWWRDQKLTYMVFFILARDVLTISVSTTSSESDFSLARKILDERRASLTLDMTSTIMIVKDGKPAKIGNQRTPVNPKLIAEFQMFI